MWNIITIQSNCFFFIYISNVIYFCNASAEFSAPLLQSSVSHDPSEIILICWIDAKETFLIIINAENRSIMTTLEDFSMVMDMTVLMYLVLAE